VQLPEEFQERIRALSLREHVSPFMIYTAAFQGLLALCTHQEDIGVAACVANRNSTKVEALVGPISNRVILRTDVSGNPTHHELFRRVRKVALDAYSHQDVPFGELVERIAEHPGYPRNPFFQVLMILQADPRNRWNARW
jgi:non-ribosomal peptide synthetase component F